MHANPMTTTPAPQTTEMAPRAAEGTGEVRSSTHRDLRHALAAERVRIRHMCKALACARDAGLRQRWQSEMEDGLARVWEIEQALRANATQADQHAGDKIDECLLEAMDLARANGDSRAAEAVAMECMALVELRCLRIRQGRTGQVTMLPDRTHHKEQNSHEKYQ